MRWNTSTFHGESRRRNTTVAALLVAAAVVALVAFLATRADAKAASAALTDAQIVAIFDLANTADIETGRLGAERAQNKEVKDYATMLAQVHTAVRKSGRDLAKKLGVTPILPADDKSAQTHAAVMTRLGKLSGAEFDRAFLEHERAFHVAVLSAVKSTLLPAIQNQELKEFVVSLAPAFEAHRLAAENLQNKLGFK
jgi:putative membrane protein